MHFRIVMNVLLKDAVCVEPDSLMDGKVPSQNIVYKDLLPVCRLISLK